MADEAGVSKDPRRWAGWRAGVALAGALVAFGLVWWLVPPLLYRSGGTPDALLTAITTTRAALLAGFVGLGALGTFWVNSRTLQITARTADVSARTLTITEQGHLTDRYTKAISQLGDDKLDIRLGGVYALERLAVDSERDHPTVVEVLSAFIRERRRHDRIEEIADSEPAAPAEAPPNPASWTYPTTDVQAALTVLGRLPKRDGVSRADLSGAYLPGARLIGADLTGATLRGADLTGAALIRADLTGANLIEANLTRAALGEATLAGANLREANLTTANLIEANLTDAYLVGATLADALLAGATLTGAHLIGADLTRAALGGATLTGATLIEANLTSADLGRATLTSANLRRADLTSADLGWADLTDARNLTNDQIALTQGHASTTLPPGLTRPESWT